MKPREEAARKVAALLAETPLGHGLTDAGVPVGWEGEHGATCIHVLGEFLLGNYRLAPVQWELLQALLEAILAACVPTVRNDVYTLPE